MVAASVVFGPPFAAGARHIGPNFESRGIRTDLDGSKAFLELGLSASQRVEMMSIINRYENQRETLRNSIAEAEGNVTAVLHAEQFNEEHTRRAFREGIHS
jgi:hypothetical protein